MSDVLSFVSLAVSVASLWLTVSAYRRLSDEASETFAVIGADEGNHEARLERLETNAHLKVIPSPSMLDYIEDEGTSAVFKQEFDARSADAALRADQQMHDEATNEGMAHHGD